MEKRRQNKEIYVVLTQTNTILASTIRLFSKAKYSHVSLSMDSKCKDMYSFGRKYYYIPFYGCFKNELLTDRIFSGREDNTIAIYKLSVTNEELRQIKRNITRIERSNKGFNVVGLAAALINIKLDREKYYCAEFVHEAIHDRTNLLEDLSDAVRPQDIVEMNERFELCYEGTIQEFLRDLEAGEAKSLPTV